MEEVTRPLEQSSNEIPAQNVLAILMRRKWLFLQIAGVILLSFILFGIIQRPIYEASAWMFLAPEEKPSQNSLLVKSPLFSASKSEMVIHIKFLHRGELVQKVIKDLDIPMTPREFIDAATISEVANSSGTLISIAFRHTDPEFATKVVNHWAELYEAESNERSTASTMSTIAYVEGQLSRVEAELDAAAEQAAVIERQNLETGIAGGSVVSAEQYAVLLSELETVRAEEAAVAANLARTRQMTAVEPDNLEEIEKQPSIKAEAIEEQVAELNIDLQRMLKDYYDDSSEVKSVREHIARLKNQLENDSDLTRAATTTTPNPTKIGARDAVLALSGELDGLRARKNVIMQQVARQRGIADIAPVLGIEYAALKRESLGLEQVHSELLSRLYELRIQEKLAVPPIRLGQVAELPTKPVAPHLASILGVGIIMALVTALIMALTIDYLDDTFASGKEMSDMLHTRVIGTLPSNADMQTPISPDNRSPHANAVRRLASVLRIDIQRHQRTKFAVTSTRDGEGRSTVAANLAVVLARSGMDVLLVDSDVHAPAQHRIFNVDNATGFSSLMLEQGALDGAIRDVDEPNLRIIPAGPVPFSAVDLIGYPHTAKVVDRINKAAEIVIWDTSPIAYLPDATLIANQADAAIFIIEQKTKRKAAVQAFQTLRDSGIHVLGAVANCMRTGPGAYGNYCDIESVEQKTKGRRPRK